ncbi:MAG: 1-deoxy-D-xylulose-5-phosphate reductoisomerase [Acidimicrobiia bacterium]|nr:1-deoxy-D-xylulose-5-phosphate reductoisomerase [Acidimicrobiia bacterium]
MTPRSEAAPRSVAVVGSTGSIGTQTIDVVAHRPDDFRITALAAGNRLADLADQAASVRPEIVAVGDEHLIPEMVDRLRAVGLADVEIVAGSTGLAEVSSSADIIVNGVVGFAGLSSTLAALNAGKRLALANKESLIAAGPVVQKARRTPGAELVPVDSEHAAVHQCLLAHGARAEGDQANRASSARRIQLTASGGPFRGYSAEQLAAVSVENALAHPTWSMGPKITVDSSTLMNKGLEVIEAHELFGPPAGSAGYGIGLDDIEVVVHPQSIVHSMVTYCDGSTIAQLSQPDMRLPIAYALAFPGRFAEPFGAIDWSTLGRLDFEPPDRVRFPCLDLAYQAGRIGGTAPAWISAANEVAVEAFLEGRIRWTDIAQVIERVMSQHDGGSGETLDEVLDADSQARKYAEMVLP